MDPESDFFTRFCELTAGETQSETARRLGYTQSYIGQIKRRLHPKPSRDLVERVISAYHLDREDWLRSAGFSDPLPQSDSVADVVNQAVTQAVDQAVMRATHAVNGAQRLAQGIFELSRRFGRPVPVYLHGGADTLTVEEADRLIADFEQQMLAEAVSPPPTGPLRIGD